MDLVYRAIEEEASIDDVRAMLREIGERHGVRLLPTDESRPYMSATVVDSWCERSLFPFLDETHLTLAGGDFCNDVDLCDASGAQLGCTWRAWGGILADWANSREWPKGWRGPRWTYLDFYMERLEGTAMYGYRDFVRVVRAAIGVR